MTDLPHDPDAEAAVLGAVLQSAAALTEVAPLLAGGDFYVPAHELVWAAVMSLADEGHRPDPITVADVLARTGSLERAGGAPALFAMVDAVPVVANVGYYARIVRERAALRRLLAAGARIVQTATETGTSPDDVASAAMTALADAIRPDPTADRTRIGDLVDTVIDDLETPPDMSTAVRWPWKDVNRAMRPLSPGQLVLLAGRPGAGKSVSCVDVARDAAIRQGRTVVLHTLEMSREEVIKRVLAAEARIPLDAIMERTLTSEHWARLATAREALAEAPLHIVDTPTLTSADLRASIDRHHPDLLVLDYVQLGTLNPKTDRRVGLEEFVRGLKLTAKAAGIPILAAAQLGRGPEMRTDHTPQLSDLRETGSLENDADAVVLLYRPDYYERESTRAGEVDLIVAKQRNGKTETVTLCHQLHYSRFVDMAA